MKNVVTDKFWIIGDFEHYLIERGMSGRVADLVTFFFTLILIFIIIMVFDYFFNRISVKAIHKITERTTNKWDDYLANRHFFRRAIRFIMAIILVYVIEFFLQGYDVRVINVSVVIMELVAVFYLLLMLFAILDTLYDIYQTLPRAKEKSIKGYIQTIKIVLVIIAVILAMVIIFKVSFGKFFTGIAASAAIVTLVFKDVILGFIASIQLSVQDMVRLGDWIEMPTKKANGTVVELNVSTVKVQNWDMTYTMIPIYAMVSDSFVNWRGMQEGTGRRFLRQFYVDINTIKPVSVDTIDALRNNPIVNSCFDEMMRIKVDFAPDITTNVSLFRAYTEAFLKSSALVNTDMTIIVNYLPMTDSGLPLQVYAFTRTKVWVDYERVVSEITESIMVAGLVFDLRFYQRSTNPPTMDNPPHISLLKDLES